MYAELDLKFKQPIDRTAATKLLKAIAGGNEIPIADALQGTPLANVPGIVNAALAAEQVRNAATIIYFMEGNDTIKAHIVVRSLAEVRKQCSRLTRQVSKNLKALAEANATVLVQVRGTDEAVLAAKKVSFWRRSWENASEKFVGKFVPAALTFALAGMFLPGTTAFQSAMIGAIAACLGALVEAMVVAINAEEWKWKDLP